MSAIIFTSTGAPSDLILDSDGFRRVAIFEIGMIVTWGTITTVMLIIGFVPVAVLAQLALMFLFAVFMLVHVVHQRKIARWSENCEITLNDKGLFFTNGQKRSWWSWQDLLPFEVHTAIPLLSWTGDSHVRIAMRGESALRRFMRSWREPSMILDAYDTPLADIAAKLNEYRGRALDDGGVAG